MENRIAPRAAAVAAAAAVLAGVSLVAGAAVPAAASGVAGSPGWRVTQKVANLTVGGLWAGGPRDAWLAGDACAHPVSCGSTDSSNGTVVVRHWNGRAWRTIRPPKAYVNTRLDQGAGPVAATSPSDAWIFADRGRESVDYTDVLHWTGRKWARPVRLNTVIESAVAPSATAVWAFGSPTFAQPGGYVARYNGRTWTHGSFPVDGQAAGASSPSDIWVGGPARSGRLDMEHWDGHSWHATRLPGVGASPRTPAYIVGVTAIGPRDVWADATVFGAAIDSWLLHFDGTSWTRTRLPDGASTDGPVVPDGRGGLWLAADTRRSWFFRYRHGHWAKTPVPGTKAAGQISVDQIAWIPRTRSVWATGDTLTNVGTAILKYGP